MPECRQLYLVGGFVSSVAAYVSTKAVYETEVSTAKNGIVEHAHVPCFLMLLDMFAMGSLSFAEVDELLSLREISSGLPALRGIMVVVWPAVLLQLVDEICFRFALSKIAASLFATVRNLRIPLSATLRSCCLGGSYTPRQWLALLGIVLCTSLATYTHQGEKWTSALALGMCFTIGSICASTFKAVLEEIFLQKEKLEPVQMASAQGILLCGLALLLLFVADATGLEPFALTMRIVQSSSVLRWNILFFFIACVFDAYMKVMITAKYDSCTKMLVSALAVCGTLVVELILGHFTEGRRGIVLHLPFSVICMTGIGLTAAITAHYSALPGPAQIGEERGLLGSKTDFCPS